jgi:hypothetical protein
MDREAVQRHDAYLGRIEDMPDDERLFLLGYLSQAVKRLLDELESLQAAAAFPPVSDRQGALRFRCPRCGAKPGSRCRVVNARRTYTVGAETLMPHTGRRDAYLRSVGRLEPAP